MKPSEKISEKAKEFSMKNPKSPFANIFISGILDYLDEEYEKHIQSKIGNSDNSFTFTKNQGISLGEYTHNGKTLEEVLALFPYIPHETEGEQTYSWEYIQEKIKQLYNQQ